MLGRSMLAGILVLVASVVAAETQTIRLDDMSGSVMVNEGRSYEPAQPGMELKPNYRLMAMAGSSATIDYAGQCALSLGENQIIRIGDSAACLNRQVGGGGSGSGSGSGSAGGGAAGGAGSTGAGAAAGAGSAGATAAAATTGTIFGATATTAVLVGGAVVAGAVVVNNNDDDNGPISR